MQSLLFVAAMAVLGNPSWVETTDDEVLDAAQKSGLASTVAAIWPGVTPSGVVQLHCVRELPSGPRPTRMTRCRPIEKRTGTMDQFDAAQEATMVSGGMVSFVGEDAGTVTWHWSPGYKELSSGEQTAMASWVVLVWPGVQLSSIVDMLATKLSAKVAGQVTASLDMVKTGTKAEYLASLKAGKVKRRHSE